ncbi:MAG: amidohydrolase family protein [Roseivirga sp.]
MKDISRLQLISAFITLLVILTASCKEGVTYDLAITDVQVFDPYSGQVNADKTILISGDEIAAIIDKNDAFAAAETIAGQGRLITPGFVDTHIHFGDIYGNYDEAPEYLVADSVGIYKKQFAETFLPFGVTSVAVMGQPEKWLPTTLLWQQNPQADLPNVYITGAAIISDDERTPYIGHVEVLNPELAREKVREYHHMGLSHLKLYWRLRLPEMEAVVDEAKKLGIKMFAHPDNQIVPIHTGLDLGIRNFEHALTVSMAPFVYAEHNQELSATMEQYYPGIEGFFPYLLEQIQLVHDKPALRAKRDELIDRMIREEATLSTTIHLFGSIVKRTFFNTYVDNYYANQNPDLDEEQLVRLNKAFDTFMTFIKDSHDKGLKIRIGTDCKDGGKALLSEMLLLHEAGFSMADTFKIATINGAEAMEIDADFGSITAGKKADLVLFENNPFENPKALLDQKTVIKGGKVY